MIPLFVIISVVLCCFIILESRISKAVKKLVNWDEDKVRCFKLL